MENNGSIPDQLPKSTGIKSVWMSGCATEDERKNRLAELTHNLAVFDTLRDILQDMYNSSKKRSREARGSTDWATQICAEQRYRDALEDVHKILPALKE